jgi:hypothetical protein
LISCELIIVIELNVYCYLFEKRIQNA